MGKEKHIGIGIYVRDDINGNPVHVGDTVRVTRPSFSIPRTDDEPGSFDYPEKVWEGVLILRFYDGLLLKSGYDYIKPKLTDRSRLKWKWEKL